MVCEGYAHAAIGAAGGRALKCPILRASIRTIFRAIFRTICRAAGSSLVAMDAELLQQLVLARNGDVQAFGYVAAAFRGQALAWAREIDRTGAEDALQNALLAAWRGLGGLEDVRAFPGWLRVIVRNAALREVRRTQPMAEVPAEAAAPEDAAPDAELLAAVKGAVRGLSAVQQSVVERHYMQGQKIEEIAAALGVPVGTVKRRLHDAREALRLRLSGFAPGRDADWLG